jgi:hypothetical protein
MQMNFLFAFLRNFSATLFGSKISVICHFFFGLAWLWSWYFGPVNTLIYALKNKAFYIATLYGITNELAQAFIPDRFPSAGDLIMNLAGCNTWINDTFILCRKLGKPKLKSI